MIYTEEEAKTKWCSQARVFFSGSTGSNRFGAGSQLDASTKCLASACMHWEEDQPLIETSMIPPHMDRAPSPPPGSWTLESDNGRPCWRRIVARRGRCGLNR